MYASMASLNISAETVGGRAIVNMDVSETIAGTAAGIPYVCMSDRIIGAPFAVRYVLMAKGVVNVKFALWDAF